MAAGTLIIFNEQEVVYLSFLIQRYIRTLSFEAPNIMLGILSLGLDSSKTCSGGDSNIMAVLRTEVGSAVH